ncbi:MAG: sigma-70 family RNA polymerase sigma factor [Gaiellaceae bacterium]
MLRLPQCIYPFSTQLSQRFGNLYAFPLRYCGRKRKGATGGTTDHPLAAGPAGVRWLDSRTARRLLEAYRLRGDRGARELLIEGHLPLVEMLARRYCHRGEELEDLVQVGAIGLILAIDRFDLDRRVELTTFVVPTVVGEIQRHLRDRTTPVRLPRRLQELSVRVRRPRLELAARLERSPTPAELSREVGLPEDDVAQALDTERASMPLPLARGGEPGVEPAATNGRDPYDAIEDRLELAAWLRLLDKRERRILQLRFLWGLSQSEIARAVGISQVHVSRLLQGALGKLRAELEDETPVSMRRRRPFAAKSV